MAEATVANPIIAAHLKVLERNFKLIVGNLEGVTHEQSLIPFMAESSHFNWLLGHLTHSRNGILRLLGADAPWSPERGEPYGIRSTPGSPQDAEPFEQLVAAYTATQPLIEAALQGASEADLEREAGTSTVGARLEFLVWHESYHSGQTTIYRRLAGLDRTLP